MKHGLCLILGMIGAYTLIVCPGCEKKDVVNESELPHYYEINRTECLNKFLPFVQDTILRRSNKDLFKMVHISDAHVSSWSSSNSDKRPYNLLEAVRFANDPEAGFHVLAETGDHISNSMKTTREEALGYLDVFAGTLYNQYNMIPTLTATGNHDANMLNPDRIDFALSKTDMYNHLTSRTNYPIHTTGRQNYYYADVPNPSGGIIRFISLDVMDQDQIKYDAQHHAIFTKQQVNWFCETALKENMTPGHSVIILIHYPLSSNDAEVKRFTQDDFLYNWTFIPEIIEAFRGKRDFARKYCNRLDATDTLTVDVSFHDTPGEFVCYLGGHIHTFMYYEVDGFKTLNPALPKQIMIIANNMSPSDKNQKSTIEREVDGLRNNTFNVYAIDTDAKIIYITAFGATGFYYPQMIMLKYL
jgi:predicted MPP superfamily phosphohydrolase